MIRRRTVETIEEYDENGRLVTKTVREENEDDDNIYYSPAQPTASPGTSPWWSMEQPYTTWCKGGCDYGTDGDRHENNQC